jgi:hypothetical protein
MPLSALLQMEPAEWVLEQVPTYAAVALVLGIVAAVCIGCAMADRREMRRAAAHRE